MNIFLKLLLSVTSVLIVLFVAHWLFFFPTELKVKWTYSKHSEVLKQLAGELSRMDLDKEFVITELTISNSSSKREQKVWELVKKAGLPNFVNDNKGPRLFMGILESEGRKFGAWLIYGSLETRPVCERAMLNDSVGQCAIDLSGPWYYSVDWHENNK